VECPQCREVLKLYAAGSDDPIVEKTLAKIRYYWVASILLFFAPPVVAGISLMLRLHNASLIAFFASPVLGAVGGAFFGAYLHHQNGTGLSARFILGLIGAIVCPVLTFAGCALAGNIG